MSSDFQELRSNSSVLKKLQAFGRRVRLKGEEKITIIKSGRNKEREKQMNIAISVPDR